MGEFENKIFIFSEKLIKHDCRILFILYIYFRDAIDVTIDTGTGLHAHKLAEMLSKTIGSASESSSWAAPEAMQYPPL